MAESAAQAFDYRKATQGKSINKFCDMAQEIANEAQDIVISAVEKFMKAERLEVENATKTIKDQMDKTFGPSWHCVIGEGLAFDITSQKNNLLFMYYAGYLSVLLWKC